MLRWPAQDAQREKHRDQGEPRLLVIDRGTPAPLCLDELEDWIRLPAGREDVEVRLENLRARAAKLEAEIPKIRSDHMLCFRGTMTRLSGIDARIMDALISSYGLTVSRSTLVDSGWPDRRLERSNVLDLRILRLRRRLRKTDLEIRTCRGSGYVLTARSADLSCLFTDSEEATQ